MYLLLRYLVPGGEDGVFHEPVFFLYFLCLCLIFCSFLAFHFLSGFSIKNFPVYEVWPVCHTGIEREKL